LRSGNHVAKTHASIPEHEQTIDKEEEVRYISQEGVEEAR
jgi:hypothetical protein